MQFNQYSKHSHMTVLEQCHEKNVTNELPNFKKEKENPKLTSIVLEYIDASPNVPPCPFFIISLFRLQ